MMQILFICRLSETNKIMLLMITLVAAMTTDVCAAHDCEYLTHTHLFLLEYSF